MGRLIRLFLLLIVLAAVVAPVALALYVLEGQPLIARAGKLDLRELRNAEALAQRFDPRLMSPGRVTIVRVTSGQLNLLIRGALGGVPRATGRAVVTRYGVVAAVTVETPLPRNPLGRFVNLRATIAPSRSGLVVSRLALGRLEIPRGLVRPVLDFALDRLLGAGKGGPVLDSVQGVWIRDGVVSVAFRPLPGLAGKRKATTGRRARAAGPCRSGIGRRIVRAPLFRRARQG